MALTVWKRFWWPKAWYREKIPEILRKCDTAKIFFNISVNFGRKKNHNICTIYLNFCCRKFQYSITKLKQNVEIGEICISSYALTEQGEELAGQLYQFQQSVQRFLKLNNVPHIPQSIKYVSPLLLDDTWSNENKKIKIRHEIRHEIDVFYHW